MSKPISRLGRGLSGIIGTGPVSIQKQQPVPATPPMDGKNPMPGAPAVRSMPIEQLVPNPRQPRTHFDDDAIQALASSIRATGILQPLIVRPLPSGSFELVAGERRWRAAKLAGLSVVPALVHDVDEARSLELALIENLQREDLGPLERAAAYQQYIDTFRATPEHLAAQLGESRANVVNYLRILRLPDEIQEMIRSGRLAMGQARALVGIGDAPRQLAVARLAVRRNLSVRQVEELARTGPDPLGTVEKTGRSPDRHVRDVEESLSKALGLPVALRAGKRKNAGRIIIRYNSLEEFDRIAERLTGNPAVE
jgi:ParB family chromosome partitioning protein